MTTTFGHMSLTKFIKDDLVARLCRSELTANDLTYHGIAGRYAVSISPVRAALKELVDEGYFQKGPNHRLNVNAPRVAEAKKKLTVAPTRPKEHLQIIANDFIRQSLSGEAISVREEAIAEQYGLSRTSVRQIFHRLAGQGILEHIPRHGWRLRPFRQADLDSFIEVRTVLERKAMELAWPHLVDADLTQMLEGNRLPKTAGEAPANDNSIHGYLIEKSSNHYIADFFARHGQYYSVLFDWEAQDEKALLAAIRQHRRILKALLARDAEAADRALVHHIRSNHPVLTTILKEM